MRDAAETEPPDYRAEHIRAALARDPRVQEPELGVEVHGGRALVTGIVPTPARRSAIEAVVRETCPDLGVDNLVTIVAYSEPPAPERIE
jgi:osmotically-inducible protein OsmY